MCTGVVLVYFNVLILQLIFFAGGASGQTLNLVIAFCPPLLHSLLERKQNLLLVAFQSCRN